jgi:threonine aldolase
VVAEADAHVLWSEESSFAYVAGLTLRPLEGSRGRLAPGDVAAAIEGSRFGHRPRTAVVCLENTHNAAGGAVLRPADIAAVADVAAAHGAAVHVDGARIFNAAVALEASVAQLTARADTVSLNLTKGLSAPTGAVLCGREELVREARTLLRRLGSGSVHKAGLWAAAGLVAIETMVGRLADDHRRARALARRLAPIAALTVDEAGVETNIVMAELASAEARELVAALARVGVGATVHTEHRVRFVTHRHVGDGDIDEVAAAVASVCAPSRVVAVP